MRACVCVICVICAYFYMAGLDVKNLRYVINYDMPKFFGKDFTVSPFL